MRLSIFISLFQISSEKFASGPEIGFIVDVLIDNGILLMIGMGI